MTNADPIALIDQSLRAAIHAAFGEGFDDVDPILREAQKREFGDWQANVAMGLGKRLGKPPREVAETILSHVDFGEVVSESSIAGPGFINLRLRRRRWLRHCWQWTRPLWGGDGVFRSHGGH